MTSRSEPDVSIIIAAWNAEAFISRAIESALAQTDVSFEIIVIDDASTDATGDAVKTSAAGDERLTYERLPVNSGPSGARNRALELARGRYVAVLDADDAMASERLHKLVSLADQTDADIVADNMLEVPWPETEPGDTPFLSLRAAPDPLDATLAVYVDPETDVRFGGSLGYLKPVFRRETLKRLSVSYDVSLRNSEDYYLVAGMIADGAQMLITSYAGYHYTVRAGSISHRLTPNLTAALLAAEAHFNDRYQATFDEAERQASRQRGKMLRNSDTFVRFVTALKSRKPVAATGIVLGQPAAAPHVISELMRIAGEKTRKRRSA